jgi:ribosomal protein S18 acetylase RimI-like enzyme
MSYTFRDALPSDREAIFALYERELRPYIEQIWGWDIDWQRADFNAHFNPQNMRIIDSGNDLVGYIHVDKDSNWHIRMMVVASKYQGNGLGGRLLDDVISAARIIAAPLTLSVFKLNDGACRLYVRKGFQVIEESKESYTMRYPY